MKKAHETIALCSSIELTYIPVMDSCVTFQYSSSSYILYELELKKKFLYQHHYSKQSLVDFTCRQFPYQVKSKDFHNQDPYVVMHFVYYGQKPLFDKHFPNSQPKDYKSSATWEATRVCFLYLSFFLYIYIYMFCFVCCHMVFA